MPKGYHHLACPERFPIEPLRTIGISYAAIAPHLGYDRPTVYRETKRNSGQRRFFNLPNLCRCFIGSFSH